jgi:hypothetical protein
VKVEFPRLDATVVSTLALLGVATAALREPRSPTTHRPVRATGEP